MVRTTTALLAAFLAVRSLFADGIEVAEPRIGTTEAFYLHEARVVTNGDRFLAQSQYSLPAFVQGVDRDGRATGSPRAGWWNPTIGFGSGYLTVDRRVLYRLDAHGSRIGTIVPDLPPAMGELRVGGANDSTILLMDTRPTITIVDHGGRFIASHTLGALSMTVMHVEATSAGYDLLVSAYAGDRVFQLFRLSNDGSLSAPITLAPQSVGAAVATYVGSGLMVAWAIGPVIQTAVVAPDGSVTRGMDRSVWLAPLTLVPHGAGAWLIGTRTGPAYPGDKTGWAVPLDETGREAGQALPIAEGRRVLAAASNGRIIYVLSAEPAPVGERLIGSASLVTSPVSITIKGSLARSPATQLLPAAAANANQALIVWQERSAEEIALRGRFIVGGQPFGDPIEIHSGARETSAPLLAAADGTFLVAWMEAEGLRAKRVATNGIVLDASPIPITSPFYAGPIYIASVASNGRDFAIVWQLDGGLAGRTVSQHGAIGAVQLLTTVPPRKPDEEWQIQALPSLTWDGSRYVLVWSQYFGRNGFPGWYVTRADARGRFFDSELKPAAEEIAVAAETSKALVAQGRDSSLIVGQSRRGLIAMLMNRSLRPVAEAKLGNGTDLYYETFSPLRVVAAWDGRHYVAAWREENILHLAKIDLTGAVIFTHRTALASDPVVASTGSAALIVVAERRADGDAPPRTRIMLYGVEDFAPPASRRRSARH
jgi:hypothetical protein